MKNVIPIIDLFAGPGGLGEGFSSLYENDSRVFKIALSIECDEYAHKTLTLRSFFRQFNKINVPIEYYEYLRGEISLNNLFEKYPFESASANKEAWLARLGEVPNTDVDDKIKQALNGAKDWLLIGGPPCQAYSVVGRSRRQETILDASTDKRVDLYKQYLRILAIHNPSIFVMENVKGLLSAKTKNDNIFSRILVDLENPTEASLSEFGKNGQTLKCPGYNIYSLVSKPQSFELNGKPSYENSDFVIRSEDYGIPQCRHRIILLGIRKDIETVPEFIVSQTPIAISKVLAGLPRLRSSLSKQVDESNSWKAILINSLSTKYLSNIDKNVKEEIKNTLEKLTIPQKSVGSEYIPYSVDIDYNKEWFIDESILGVCNHKSRGHMESDLYRYLFVACFAKIYKYSPKLSDFPDSLLPKHENIVKGKEDEKFADRFRVQLFNVPSKTITSHISKDGHYYIHPDPTQCRSFTVREAARIQTFPDNYYFCGPRTSQFTQVGNAVPPLLANKIAQIVFKVFKSSIGQKVLEENNYTNKNLSYING